MIASTAPPTEDVEVLRFAAAARAGGYDGHRTDQMLEAARRLELPLGPAADWLAVDLTPWGAAHWISHGIGSPDEAASYMSQGVGAEAAYWLEFDRRRDAASVAPTHER